MIVLLCFFIVVTVALSAVCVFLYRRVRDLEKASVANVSVAEGETEAETPHVDVEQEVPAVEMPPALESLSAEADDVELGGAEFSRPKIVVVDDSTEMRESLAEQLSADFDVLVAEDGEKGLALARESIPDLVVSDVRMPVMTGYELCHALRQDSDICHIPVILVSALSERENIIYGLEVGADDYIVKPFDMEVLRMRIRSVLKRNQMQRDMMANSSGISKMEYKNQQDKELMDRVMAIVAEHLSDSDFAINHLCMELGMSRSSVYGRIKVLTGHGPKDIIKVMRLEKAHEMLLKRGMSVTEVAYSVGFSDPKYFSTCFKKQFGISPTKV